MSYPPSSFELVFKNTWFLCTLWLRVSADEVMTQYSLTCGICLVATYHKIVPTATQTWECVVDRHKQRKRTIFTYQIADFGGAFYRAVFSLVFKPFNIGEWLKGQFNPLIQPQNFLLFSCYYMTLKWLGYKDLYFSITLPPALLNPLQTGRTLPPLSGSELFLH